jgi:hypothetical protein
VRFSGTLVTGLSGCNAFLAITVYVETEAAAVANTIDVDDFQLIDVTPTSVGTGGASSTGGAPATGGAVGTLASGGLPNAG